MEGTAVATWTRESPSLWAYPTILALHSFGLAVVAGGGFAIDLRLLGRARAIPLKTLEPVFTIVWWGFAVNAASGLLLFMADATHKSTQPVFGVKLACIVLALAATAGMARQVKAAGNGKEPGTFLPIVSIVLWLGAITAGRLMAYM